MPIWRRALGVILLTAGCAYGAPGDVTFVLTSDVHFGITRPRFRGETYVNATVVNAAEVRSINALPDQTLPSDGGLRGGERIGRIDFVAITGDLANRQELYPVHIQPAAASWAQFERCYVDGLTLNAPLYYLRSAWTDAVTRLEANDPRIAHYVFRHWTVNHPRVPDDQAMAAELVRWLRDQPWLAPSLLAAL